VIRLEENYRSTQNILDVAAVLIRHNVERKEKRSGRRIQRAKRFATTRPWTRNLRRVSSPEKSKNICAGDRGPSRGRALSHQLANSRVFGEAMRRAGLSYNIVGGFSFYERMEVRDIIAY